MALGALREAIDELVSLGPAALGDAETVQELQCQLARLDAVATAAVGSFAASGDWSCDGAKTAAAWVAVSCRLPKGSARRLVRRGRELRHLESFAGAWRAGAINAAHIDAVLARRKPWSQEAMARDEEDLVKRAKRVRFEEFERTLTHWANRVDADGAELSAEDVRDRRDVYLVASFEGMYLGQMTLDALSGAIVSGELERLEAILFEEDCAKAEALLGRRPTLAELGRTPAQRRADALVEMATRSRSMPEGARRPLPLFSVLVGWETLGGRVLELAQGAALTPGSLVPWISHCDLERAVFEPGGRVEVSAHSRFFTGGLRRAIELRDRRCTHPMCDEPAERCQADHIIPYSLGGLTVQENGRLLCGFHNRLRNQRPPPDLE
jgi:hypothetical protein